MRKNQLTDFGKAFATLIQEQVLTDIRTDIRNSITKVFEQKSEFKKEQRKSKGFSCKC